MLMLHKETSTYQDMFYLKTTSILLYLFFCQAHLLINSTALFYNNSADNGGALYIEYYTLYVNQTTLEFVGNSATSNGGAIFIDGGAIIANQTSLKFINNTAMSYGGAVYVAYVDLICNGSDLFTLLYFYNMLVNASVYEGNSAAKAGDYAYCNLPQNYLCDSNGIVFDKKELFSSSVYRVNFLGEIKVSVNKVNYYSNHTAP